MKEKYFFSLCLCLICIECYGVEEISTCGVSLFGQGFIVRGENLRRGAFPWMVPLYYRESDVGTPSYFCGGTIVSRRHILSAAHCFKSVLDRDTLLARDIFVKLGGFDLGNPHEFDRTSKSPSKIILHEDWNPHTPSFDADLAVLVMGEDILFSRFVQPVCLWTSNNTLTANGGTVAGWGQSEDTRDFEPRPKQLNMSIHTNEDCFLDKPDLIEISSRRTFCAGSGKGNGTCNGDSGSGFVVKYSDVFYLMGIASSGLLRNGQCDMNVYSVFTNLLKFKDWLKNATTIDNNFEDNPSRRHPHGHQFSVMNFDNEDHAIVIHTEKLDKILLHPEVKDRKIVVVSIIGAFRKGKSFFMDYCLRYMYGNYKSINYMNNTAANKNDWIGAADEPLKGFSWKSGSKRHTTGVLIWSDVFLHEEDNEKLAILLMDTQGLFDSTTSPAENSRIFALGTLLSSMQIFNLNDVIQEDQLEYLQLATNFAKFASTNSGNSTNSRTFQQILFLMRDWASSDDYSFGLEGGREYLSEILKVSPNQHPALKSVREYISESFDKIDCFLLPHPGSEKISKKAYDGRWSDLTVEFRRQLSDLVEWLLQGKHLNKKKIFGVEQTGATYRGFAESYLKAFQSNEVPEVKSIYEITVERQMLIDIDVSVEDYKSRMKQFNYSTSANLQAQIGIDHVKSKSAAIALFQSKPKWGNEQHAYKYTLELSQTIRRFYKEWKEDSLRRILEAEEAQIALKVRDCTLAIISGDSTNAKNILNQLNGSDKIVEIIRRAYGNAKMLNLLQFLGAISATQRYLGFKALYDRMESNNNVISSEALLFAFHMKNSMERTADQVLKNGYERMKSKMPLVVRAIIWSVAVHLKNTYYGDYLYVSAHGRHSNSDRRSVFTWAPGVRVYEGKWKFETNDGVNFYILSEWYSEYLYAESFFWDNFWSEKERRHVFTLKNKVKYDYAIWLIRPLSSDTTELRNKYYGEDLYASEHKYEYERRNVFTWSPDSGIRESTWKVEL